MGEDYYRSILRTFLEQFAYAATFRVSDADLLCIGSNQPIKISPAQAHALFDDPAIRNDLQGLGINSPGSLVARWIGGRKGLYNIAGQAQLNTDNNGYVEFGSPLYLYQNVLNVDRTLLEDKNLSRELSEYLEWDQVGGRSKYFLLEVAEQAIQQGSDNIFHAVMQMIVSQGDSLAWMYLRGRKAESIGDWHGAAEQYQEVANRYPSFYLAHDRLLRVYLSLHSPIRAQAILKKIARDMSEPEFHYWQGIIDLQRNKPQAALGHFKTIDASRLREPEVFLNLYGYAAAVMTEDITSRSGFADRLRKSLHNLRIRAEMDNDLTTVASIVNQLSTNGTSWLKGEELPQIQDLVAKELLEPLNLYTKAVNTLLAGRFSEAELAFDRLVGLVSEQGGVTKGTYFLDLLQKLTPS